MTQPSAAFEPQGAPQAPPRSVWPTVIGIISIIFGAMGIVCTPVGFAMQYLNPECGRVQESMPRWFGTYQMVALALGMLVAAFLLVAGILLLKRMRAGRTMHLVYAVYAVAAVPVNVALSGLAFSQARLEPPLDIVMPCSLVAGCVFGLSYPIFLLIWLLRSKIRLEVSTWGRPPGA